MGEFEPIRKTINIAFMAHVDVGKTTLIEHILHKSGVKSAHLSWVKLGSGVNLLNRPQYILAARGSMSGTVFD